MASTATKKTTTSKTSTKLPPNPFLFEILELVSKQRTRAKKIEVLKQYETESLKAILIWNFDETVVSMLPEGEVPFEKNDVPVGTDHTSLRKEWKNLYHFVKGGNNGINAIRRETMFINILQGLHPLEAEILTLVKDKKLETKYNISKDVVSAAYPDIVWGDRA